MRRTKIVAAMLSLVFVFMLFPSLRVNAAVVASGNCGAQGDNVTWTLDDAGVLTISGTGAMADYEYYKDTSLGIYKTSYPWYDQKDSIKSVAVEDGVTYIGSCAFRELSNLESVTLPDSVTVIGDRSFSLCPKLSSINLPNNLTLIDKYAFYECSSLTSIEFPSTLTTIGAAAFEKCLGLTEIDIPNSVTTLGEQAFAQCTSLKSATLSNQLTELPDTFYDCSQLTSVTIPDSVTTLNGTFFGCTSLTTVTIPSSVTTLNATFNGCTSLTSITIPNSVTSIGEWAFNGCTSLTSITIPNSVTLIGEYAFAWCDSLTSITIPDSVTSIGEWAFGFCSSLTDVTMTQILYDSIDTTNVFPGISPNFNLIPSGYCGDPNVNSGKNVIWVYDDSTKTLTISGSGAMANYAYGGAAPWFGFRGNITSIEISDGVTSIGDWAFYLCQKATSVTIPDTVTSIGKDAFYICTKLNNVTLPASVNTIGECAFASCYALSNITINGTITTLGAGAFEYSGITDIPSNLITSTILGGTFSGCKFTTITIPNTVTSIEATAFSDCTSLESITIPNSVTSIESWVFDNCTNLTSVTMDYSLKDQCEANNVFSYCPSNLTITYYEYAITYKDDTNGTVSGVSESYSTKDIELTVTPNNNYEIDEVKLTDSTGTTVLSANASGKYSFTMPKENVTVEATFKPIEYNITFVNEDGTVLQSSSVPYGDTPVCTITPTKAADAQYTYTFAGWDPAITTVTGDATYTAVFNKTAITTNTPAPTNEPINTPASTPAVTTPAPGTYYVQSIEEKDGAIVITIKRTENDDQTYELVQSIETDGKQLNVGDQIELTSGSAIITIKKDFVSTLTPGTHTMKVTFKDGGSITLEYTVKEPEKAQAVQATGEAISAASIAGACLILAAAGIVITVTRKRKETEG